MSQQEQAANAWTGAAAEPETVVPIAGPQTPEDPGVLLSRVGGELAARGLAVSDFQFDRMLSLIEVTNPADPGRGTVSVGRDGSLFWERRCPLNDHAAATRAVGAVIRVLAEDESSQAGSE